MKIERGMAIRYYNAHGAGHIDYAAKEEGRCTYVRTNRVGSKDEEYYLVGFYENDKFIGGTDVLTGTDVRISVTMPMVLEERKLYRISFYGCKRMDEYVTCSINNYVVDSDMLDNSNELVLFI